MSIYICLYGFSSLMLLWCRLWNLYGCLYIYASMAFLHWCYCDVGSEISTDVYIYMPLWLFFIDATVMLALKSLRMSIYICFYGFSSLMLLWCRLWNLYGCLYIYASMAFQSINYLLMAYVAPILPFRKTSSDYMVYKNIIPTFYWLYAFIW